MQTHTQETPTNLVLNPKSLELPKLQPWQRLQKTKLGAAEIILVDFLLLNLCLLGEVYTQIHFGSQIFAFVPVAGFLVFGNVLWIIVAAFTDVYSFIDESRLHLRIRDLFVASLIYFGSLSLVYDYFFSGLVGFNFLLPSLLAFLGLTSIFHYCVRPYHYSQTQVLYYAVVGGSAAQLRFVKNFYTNSYWPNVVCLGRFGQLNTKGTRDLGSFAGINSFLVQNAGKLSKLIYLNSSLSREEIQEIEQTCRNHFVSFEVVPMEVHFFRRGVKVDHLAHLPIFGRKRTPLQQVRNKILKRSFDIVISLAVIILIFPWLFPIIAIIIKLDSKGPVFFRQSRSGYWSKPFKLLKFRTMRVNDEADAKQAVMGDDRITRFGAILRKTSIDELPQFINVLLGDMSVVGPRPHMLKHTQEYAES